MWYGGVVASDVRECLSHSYTVIHLAGPSGVVAGSDRVVPMLALRYRRGFIVPVA